MIKFITAGKANHVELGRDRRAQRPRDSFTDIVRDLLICGGAHVASGTSGCCAVIDTRHPALGVEVHLVDVCAVKNAVLGLVVDLDLRMIRSHVTLAASVRRACLCRRECVACVAGRAGPERAVDILAAYAGIGPGLRRGLAFVVNLDRAAVALLTAGIYCRWAADHFAEQIVHRRQNVAGFRVVRSLLLLDLGFMTICTGGGRHNDVNRGAVVLERILVAVFGLVTVVAINLVGGVRAAFPLFVYAGVVIGAMALEAFLPDCRIRIRFCIARGPNRAGERHQ